MEKNKYTLITIIILLVLVLPGGIYGSYIHFKTTTNFKKEFKFNGKLYFYKGKKLLGKYTCKTAYCDYATLASGEQSTVINDSFVFLVDSKTKEEILLYNIKEKAVIEKYDAVKNGEGNVFLVMRDNKWGAIQIDTTVTTKVALDKGFDDLRILKGKYIGKTEEKEVMLEEDSELFTATGKIMDYNDSYVIVSEKIEDGSEQEYVYNYDNQLFFGDYQPVDKITFVDEFFLLKKHNNYSLCRLDDGEESLISSFYYNGNDELTYEKKEDTITFKDTADFEKTINLNVEINEEE